MNKLTAVIITKNEEKKINRCLASLKNVADEIVVIDDISTDATVEICKRFGAKVFINESKGNFDRQRNIGIENASGEWILQMDADEIIPEASGKRIREKISSPDNYAAFRLRRKNFFIGKPLSLFGEDNYAVKLFKKGKASYIGKSVHETLQIDGLTGTLPVEIEHYPYNSIREVIERCNFYSDIESDVFLAETNSVSIKELKKRLIWKAVKLFWKLYIKKKGYKDGMHGLAWCIVNVIGPEIKWLKIWEKTLKQEKLNVN